MLGDDSHVRVQQQWCHLASGPGCGMKSLSFKVWHEGSQNAQSVQEGGVVSKEILT